MSDDQTAARFGFAFMKRMKERYGDLNAAYVALYMQGHEWQSISEIARETGLSRMAVRRSMEQLNSLSDSDSQS